MHLIFMQARNFYLNSLQENYQLSFSDDFADVMEQIETEYKAANQLTDVSDSEGGVTTSADTLLVRNWQDILAIYVYEKSLDGATSFYAGFFPVRMIWQLFLPG